MCIRDSLRSRRQPCGFRQQGIRLSMADAIRFYEIPETQQKHGTQTPKAGPDATIIQLENCIFAFHI